MEHGLSDPNDVKKIVPEVAATADRSYNPWKHFFLTPELFKDPQDNNKKGETEDDKEGESSSPSTRLRGLLKRLGIFRSDPKSASVETSPSNKVSAMDFMTPAVAGSDLAHAAYSRPEVSVDSTTSNEPEQASTNWQQPAGRENTIAMVVPTAAERYQSKVEAFPRPSASTIEMQQPLEAPAVFTAETSQPFDVTETSKFAEAHVQPEDLLKQVAAAAERNLPLERIYERRHEIKDDPGMLQGASSVGSVLAGGTGTYGFTGLPASGHTADPLQQVSSSTPDPTGVYKTAAIRGFIGAIGIITLGIIAYIFMG
jgi:hypothetical protein